MKLQDVALSKGLSMSNAVIDGWLDFRPPARISADCTFQNVSLGAYSLIRENCRMVEASIGNYCSIAEGVRIGLHPHPMDTVTTHPLSAWNMFDFHVANHTPPEWARPQPPRIIIEDDVWIGARAIIVGARPTRIGRGAVIAAGCVVTKDVAPYAIVGGNPARPIRERLTPRSVAQLAEIRWWEYDLPRYGADHPMDRPPMSSPEKLAAWWAAGGGAKVATYRFQAPPLRLQRHGAGWKLGPSPTPAPSSSLANPSTATAPEVGNRETDFDYLGDEWKWNAAEIWRRLRTASPIAYTRRYGGVYVPTRYSDIISIAYDTKNFSSRKMAAPPLANIDLPPLTSDPPDHRIERKLLSPLLSAERSIFYEARALEFCKSLLPQIANSAVVDAAADYAWPAAVNLLCCMLDIPMADRSRLSRWVKIVSSNADSVNIGKTFSELSGYLRTLMDERKHSSGKDFISSLMATRIDGEPPDGALILKMLQLLIAASVDTTASVIAAALHHLGGYPQDVAQLRSKPELLDAATEEFLRIGAPAMSARRVLNAVDVKGHVFKPGDMVLLPFGAANRDPEAFPYPDAVRFDRQSNKHLAFGAGIHRCVGMHFARMLIKVAVREWIEAFPAYAIDPDRSIKWSSGMVRGMSSLPVRLGDVPRPSFGPA